MTSLSTRCWVACSFCVFLAGLSAGNVAWGAESKEPILKVPATDDFTVTGKGDAPAWRATEWTALVRRGEGGHPYTAQVKVLYSKTGLYV
jgi:hypothetical protein